MEDFSIIPDVGWGHAAPVVRAGNYLFLSNIIGALPDGTIVHHWDDLPLEGKLLKTGKRHLDFREGELGAQTWVVLQRLQAILQANGSSLENICKMQIYLTNKKHFPFMERVRMRLFDAQPPSSCLGVEQVDPSGEAVIAIDVVAAAVGEHGVAAKRIALKSGKQAIGIFAPGVQTTEHLFLAGQIPIDLEDGHITLDWSDLPEHLQQNQGLPFDVTYWDGPLAAQTIESYRQVERLLSQEGLTFDDVVREKVYLRRQRDYPIFDLIHRAYVPTGSHPMTVIQVSDVGTISPINLEIDVVAALEGASPRKQVLTGGDLPQRNQDAFAVRSGSLIFVGARVATDETGTKIVTTPDKVPFKAPACAERYGRISPRLSSAACQTATILYDMARGLAADGYGLANLRKLHVFLTDFRDYLAVSETLTEFFPTNPPAVSAVQMPVVGPGDGVTVAIDAIGSVEG